MTRNKKSERTAGTFALLNQKFGPSDGILHCKYMKIYLAMQIIILRGIFVALELQRQEYRNFDMSGKTGETCQKTGTYHCMSHAAFTIRIEKGETFPPCNGLSGHSTTWLFDYE